MNRILFQFLSLLLLSFGSQAQAGKETYLKYESDLADTIKYVYGNNPKVGKYCQVRGIQMYYEIYGEGEPLLLLHGNNQSIRSFIYQIDYFKKNYKVIAVDARGWGKSVDYGDTLSFEMMADDYANLLKNLKIDSANVIGWSDGGVCGLLMAIRHPGSVKKLAVTGANISPDSTAIYPQLHDMIATAYGQVKKNYEGKNKNILLRHIKKELDQPNISIAQLKSISCPVLVMAGDNDVIKLEHTFLIYKSIPKAYLWILPGAGHYTPVAFSEDFNKVVNRFVSSIYYSFDMESRLF